jgi:hypothetical protein
LKVSALRKACDNLTVVMIAFDSFEKFIQTKGYEAGNPVKEENILEVLLPPLIEPNDLLGHLNDI